MTKTEALLLWAHPLEKIIMLGKIGSRKKRKTNHEMSWLHKRSIGMSPQRLRRAVEGRTLWTSLILRVSRSWSPEENSHAFTSMVPHSNTYPVLQLSFTLIYPRTLSSTKL